MELLGQERRTRGRVQRNWFELMNGYLQWKVVPPDYNNPFKSPVAENVLRELVHKPAALKRVCKLKCVCDGYEMMSFDNLEDPAVITEHPCISAMGPLAVIDYVSRSEVRAEIEEQLEKIEIGMRELLEQRRESFGERDVVWGEEITIKEFRSRRERAKISVATAAGGYVVRYQNARAS